MSHVFISYKNEDDQFAAGLIRQIEDAGYQVWSDNERVRAGEKWREAIDQAIRDAFALIVVLTPASKASEQVMYEWTFALGVGVRVIPLMLESTELHPRLEMLPALDFTDSSAYPWGKLIRQIQEAYSSRRMSPFASRERFPPFPPRTPTPSSNNAPPSLLDRIRRREMADSDDDEPEVNLPDTEPKLLELLEHEDRDARISAARRVSELGYRDAVPALIKLLRDEDWRVRDAAAQALGKLKAAAAVPGLLETLRSGRTGPFGRPSSNTVITWAIREIGAMAVPVLIDALGDEDWRIRLYATDALGEIGDIEAVDALAMMLHDMEWRVRWRAAEALGKMGSMTAVPYLAETLRDSSQDVRISSAWALGQIGNPSAVQPLIKALYDRDWRVRWAAAEALWGIGEASVPALLELLREQDDYVRRAAIRALAEVGECAIPGLLKALSDSNWDVRWAAAEALQEMGGAAVPALVEMLTDQNWRTSWAAAEALKHIGTSEALQAVDVWKQGQPSDDGSGMDDE